MSRDAAGGGAGSKSNKNKSKIRKQITEMEAQSQTDFGPLPFMDQASFGMEVIGGNYDANNLMLVPEEADGNVLQDFDIAG